MAKEVFTETINAEIKDLFDKINEVHTRIIPIVDKDNIYTGSAVTRASVISYLTKLIKPSSLGGLATPLGVYITDGKHQAGAGNFGLFLTGMSLGSVILVIELGIKTADKFFKIDLLNSSIFPVVFILQIFLFLLILRYTPLAKIHASEHQTIHAIEKGLPLTLNTVKLQPRAHIRCGTNIMALFIGLQLVILTFVGYLHKIDPLLQFIFLFAGFMFVFSNWKKWGMWLQKNFTTVNAPDSYILNGIKVGEEILQKHKEDLDAKPASLLRKIWCMSLIQIISGFIFIQWFFEILYKLFIR